MAGKFSQPRPHRDEERQIEQSFRSVTTHDRVEYTPKPPLPKESEAEPVNFPFPEPTEETPVVSSRKATEETTFHSARKATEETTFLPVPEAPETNSKARHLAGDFTAFLNDIPEEPEETPTEPDLVDKLTAVWEKALDYAGKNRKVVLITLCALALLMICGFMGVLFGAMSDPYNKKILDNVTILDVPVGGMTKREATNALKGVADSLFAQPMVVDLSGNQVTLNAKVKFNVKAAVEAAYDYGRSGTNAENQQAYLLSKTQTYAVPLTSAILEVDESSIRATLSAYAEESGATLTQTAYGLEGTQPPLTADKFSESNPVQTLVITMGTPGVGFDVADVTKQVVESYRQRVFLVEVENVEVTRDPDPIDIRAIWEEFHIEPVEAAIDPKTGQTTPGSYGYTFDLENAQKLLKDAQFGQEIRIPMEYVAPELLDASAFFRDILGEHQTRHSGNDARNTNLRLACEAINGTVVEPGETFSFNTTTGQRNSARGYKTAPGDSTEYTTEFVGGGVSQVSSTLYYAALVADMEITSRTAGTYAPGFIDFGMDAEVGNSTDFAFRNTSSYPVKIAAQVSGGYVKVQIVGTEQRDYYVMIEQSVEKTIKPDTTYEDFTDVNPEGYEDGDVVKEGITGYSVKTYRVKYNRQTNGQLSRDFLASTSYRSENRIVAEIKEPETTAPTVPPTTAPPTTAPTETTQAATEPSTTAATTPVTEAAVVTEPPVIDEEVAA